MRWEPVPKLEPKKSFRLCYITKAWTTNTHTIPCTSSHHCFLMETVACQVQCWPLQWGLRFVEAPSSQSHQRKASRERYLWCDQIITAWEGWQDCSSLGDRSFHHKHTEKDGHCLWRCRHRSRLASCTLQRLPRTCRISIWLGMLIGNPIWCSQASSYNP